MMTLEKAKKEIKKRKQKEKNMFKDMKKVIEEYKEYRNLKMQIISYDELEHLLELDKEDII